MIKSMLKMALNMLCWRYLQYIIGPYLQGSTISNINNFWKIILQLLNFTKQYIFKVHNKYLAVLGG